MLHKPQPDNRWRKSAGEYGNASKNLHPQDVLNRNQAGVCACKAYINGSRSNALAVISTAGYAAAC
jgi:hypothetical protein